MSNPREAWGATQDFRDIQIGIQYQALIPPCRGDSPVPSCSHATDEIENDNVGTPYWIPTTTLSNSAVEQFLLISHQFYKCTEEEALLLLFTLDYDISLSLAFMQTDEQAAGNITPTEINYFQRSILKDNKLNSIKSIFPRELTPELYSHYYNTKTFESKSYLDIATELDYDDTTIFKFFLATPSEESQNDFGYFDEKILGEILTTAMKGSTFNLNKHPIFERFRDRRAKLLLQIQNKRKVIDKKLNSLRSKSDMFYNYQSRLVKARINPKWNKLEIILLTEMLRQYGPEYKLIALSLHTKDEKQVSQFCMRHKEFLRSINELDDDRMKHRMLNDYMLRSTVPQNSPSTIIFGSGPSSWIPPVACSMLKQPTTSSDSSVDSTSQASN